MSEAEHNNHGHSHGPGEDPAGYYLEQLLTLGASGALAGVAIVLYMTERLNFILHPKFHPFVLAGGLTLLALVIVRGVCLWISVGEPTTEPIHEHGPGCDHEHQHGPGCDHDHPGEGVTSLPLTPAVDHGHSHSQAHSHSHAHSHDGGHGHGGGNDHGHGHGWAPWRIILLMLPVVLFFLDLPNKAMIQAKDISEEFKLGENSIESTGSDFNVTFLMLERASLSQESRDFYTGKTVRLEGVFAGQDESKFTLTRPTMNCCAADAITLKAVILVDYRDNKDGPRLDPSKLSGTKWVRVTGTVQFLQRDGTGPFTTALIVQPTPEFPISKAVELMDKPPANQFTY
jgi:hypothetical protein